MNKLLIILAATMWSHLTLATDKLALKALSQQIVNNDFKQMTSVLVAQNDTVLYEHYFNGGGKGIKNDMRSASKSMTSLAIGLAIDQGLIDGVDTEVLPFFSATIDIDKQDERKKAITIEDLLTMSSVLECDDNNSASRGQEERMYLIEDWSEFILNLPVKGFAPWNKTPQKSRYGRAFSYCTGGVQVLTEIVEKVAKMPMNAYLQKHLFDHVGIESPKFSQTPLGYTNGAGGMRMTSRDWLVIGQLMLNQGVYHDKRLFNKKWIKESFNRRAVIDEDRKIEYGYLWWIFDYVIDEREITAYAAAGNGGNYLFMIPELKAAVVITSQAYNTQYMHQQSHKIMTDFVLPALIKTPQSRR